MDRELVVLSSAWDPSGRRPLDRLQFGRAGSMTQVIAISLTERDAALRASL
jgi:hypothetical protein